MKENTSYKIVAFLITLILWIIILGSKDTYSIKNVPIEFILPAGVTIINPLPHEVSYKVAGPRLVLKKFLEVREPMVIDLSAAPEGVTTVRLHADSINAPPGIRIINIYPSTLNPHLVKKALK